MKLTINKDSFVDSMLNPVSKLSENLLLKFSDNSETISTLVSSPDNTVILTSSLQCEIDDSNSTECAIIPDCKTFLRLFSGISSDKLVLEIDNNVIKYRDNEFSFKYYLLDEEYAVNKKSLNQEKLNSISYDTTFYISKQKFSEIIKFNSIIPDAEKLYFFSSKGKIFAKIGDEQKSSSNEIVTEVSPSFEGNEIGSGFPVNIKNVLLFSFCSDQILISINSQLKLFKFSNNHISYIVSGLVK